MDSLRSTPTRWTFCGILFALVSTCDATSHAELLVRFPADAKPQHIAAVTEEIAEHTGMKVRGVTAIRHKTEGSGSQEDGEAPEEATRSLEQAQTAYKELALDRVLTLTAEAQKRCLDERTVRVCRRILFEARMLEAVVAEARGDNDLAARSYRAAHAIDATRVVDPRRYPPRTVRSFSRACAEGEREDPLAVSLSTNPAGAAFRIDGEEVDSSGRVSIKPGQHIAEATRVGYRSVYRVIWVDEREQTPIPVEFQLVPLSDTAAWEQMRAEISRPSPDWRKPGVKELLLRFEIEAVLTIAAPAEGADGMETALALTGKTEAVALPKIGMAGEPLPADFVDHLKQALSIAPAVADQVTEPPKPPVFNDNVEDDDESSPLRLRPEEEPMPEPEAEGFREVITSPWFWVSVGAVVAVVTGVLVTTQVD